jgi:hypothetical protein
MFLIISILNVRRHIFIRHISDHGRCKGDSCGLILLEHRRPLTDGCDYFYISLR